MPAANPTLSSSHLLAPALPSFMPPALQSFMPRAIDGSSAAYATSTALPAAALVLLWCCRHWWRPRSYGCSWCYQGETSKQFNTCKIKYLSQFYITLTIPQLLATVVCKTIIEDNKKCSQTAGDFGCQVDLQWGVYCPMEHIQGFTWSHWMLTLVECLRCIASAAAMVDEFEWTVHFDC